MMDAKGHILYVGKAKDIKKRVASYFRKNLDSVKTEKLMSQVADFQVTYTDSEVQALLLEWNLITELKPRYNVLLRDDKSYPYIFLSSGEDFPRMDFHRGAKRKKGHYFGPYPNAGAVRENLAMLQKLFKLRQCSDIFFANRTRPCLQYQIKRCTAPCVEFVTKEEYGKQVEHAILFLQGKSDEITKILQQEMEQAAEKFEYENAAELRDLLIRIRKLQTKQFITGDQGDVDVLGVAQDMGQFCISVLFIRGGRLIGHRVFYPVVPIGTDKQSALAEFIPQYYLSPMRGDKAVDRIVLGEKLPDRALIEKALLTQLQYKITISDRKIEKYKYWQTLARKNAELGLSQHLAEKNTITQKLELLQKTLNLPNPIERIECFDISHMQGEATVASCVVFGSEGPIKKEYRKFNIEDITPGDDYAAMRQAILRRYTRLKQEDLELPDILIIDGGLGQLSQAAKMLEEIQVSGVMLLGISKGPGRKPDYDTIHLWGRDQPIDTKPTDPALHLIQYIRDEAHRFAILSHRAKRTKTRMTSPLENIEGIGPKRRRDLLKHFGGLQELKKAGVDQIAKVSGISEALAKKIYDALH